METISSFEGQDESKKYPPFVKYPKIPYVELFQGIWGQEGYVFEKIDGSITQIRNTDFGLVGGSRANYLTGDLTKVSWFPKFLGWMRSNKSLHRLPKRIVLFGEWVVRGRLNYDGDKLSKFYFIDLGFVDRKGLGIFDYMEAKDYLMKWGIEDVNVLSPLKKGIFEEDNVKKSVLSLKSKLGGNQIEGVVLKNYSNQEFAKILHPEYSEIREQEKTLEGRYINSQRVRKVLMRLHEEGLRNPSLESLASEVSKDIREELSGEISFSLEAVKEVIRVRGLYSYFKN